MHLGHHLPKAVIHDIYLFKVLLNMQLHRHIVPFKNYSSEHIKQLIRSTKKYMQLPDLTRISHLGLGFSFSLGFLFTEVKFFLLSE